jgi:osmotically-inducible protein OsmY
MNKSIFLLAIFSALTVSMVGCKVESDPQAQDQIKSGAQNAWKKTQEVAGNAGDTIKKSSAQAGETARIKIALFNRADVDTSNLSVETMGKTVYVRGTVPSQKDLDKAMQIIRATADTGYSVENDLKVTAPAKPAKDSKDDGSSKSEF